MSDLKTLKTKYVFCFRYLKKKGYQEHSITHVQLCDLAMYYFGLTRRFEMEELYHYLYRRGIKIRNCALPKAGCDMYQVVENAIMEEAIKSYRETFKSPNRNYGGLNDYYFSEYKEDE
jgi:hypothetical protein